MAAKKPTPPPDTSNDPMGRFPRPTSPPPPPKQGLGVSTGYFEPYEMGLNGRIVKVTHETHILWHGSRVIVGGDIEGTVIAAMIEGREVQYKVAWWDGRTRNERWMHAIEVIPADNTEDQSIGFINADR